MFHIIITVDYEIFGNGRGDVKKHIIRPANKITNIANKYNVPITIMAEVCEYWAFEKYHDKLKLNLGYDPAKEIKNQLMNFYNRGHDIQLHIHPQFVIMKYENSKFKIPYPDRRIEDFTPEEIKNILKNGIETLREFTLDSSYKPTVLRLSNMPWDEAPKKILPIMEELGFVAHSLATTSHEHNSPSNYWIINSSKILEVPIFSMPMNKLKYFTIRRLFVLSYIKFYDHSNIQFKTVKNKKMREYDAKWDFSKLTYSQLVEFLDVAMKKYDYENEEIPLVMIGHTKDFFNERALDNFLRHITENKKYMGVVKFTKFRDFLSEVENKDASLVSE